MLDFLFELVFEFLTELLFQLLIELGFEYVAEFFRRRPTMGVALAYLWIALLGAFAGLIFVNMIPTRILPVPTIPGISVLLSPLFAGLIMKAFGDWRRNKGHEPTVLATFWGGALFAFTMALVRWLR